MLHQDPAFSRYCDKRGAQKQPWNDTDFSCFLDSEVIMDGVKKKKKTGKRNKSRNREELLKRYKSNITGIPRH